jgi:acetyl-CoA carboxylase biotin carboxyl carrier protein
MNLKEIQLLVKLLSTSNVDVLEIEDGDFHLKIKKNAVNFIGNQGSPSFVPPANVALPASNPPQAEATNIESGSADSTTTASSGIEIKSPMIGTFYRSSSPDKPSFANVGDEIKVGQTICIVEAMKLFNEIESEVAGRIVKILVDDASPVEYDQPLFLVEPV